MSNAKHTVTAAQMAVWHIPALAIVAAVNPYLYFSGSVIANCFALFAGALLGGAFFWCMWLFLRWWLSRPPASDYVMARTFFTASLVVLGFALCIQWEKALHVEYICIVVMLAFFIIEPVLNVFIASVYDVRGARHPGGGRAASKWH